MRDRLEEFKECVEMKNQSQTGAIPKVPKQKDRADSALKIFLSKVETIQNEFNEVDQNICEIMELHSEMMDSWESFQNIEPVYEAVQDKLRTIDNQTKNLEESYVNSFYATEGLIVEFQIEALKDRMFSTITSFYYNQEEFKAYQLDVIKRRAIISGVDPSSIIPYLSDETNIFMQAVFDDYNYPNDVLEQLSQRHMQFKKLENSLTILRNLMFDMSIIIQHDESHINRISSATFSSAMLVEKAKNSTADAKKEKDQYEFTKDLVIDTLVKDKKAKLAAKLLTRMVKEKPKKLSTLQWMLLLFVIAVFILALSSYFA